jgi:hypothetical protein
MKLRPGEKCLPGPSFAPATWSTGEAYPAHLRAFLQQESMACETGVPSIKRVFSIILVRGKPVVTAAVGMPEHE